MPPRRNVARLGIENIALAIRAFCQGSRSLSSSLSVLLVQYSVSVSQYRASNSACRSASRLSEPGTARLRSSSINRRNFERLGVMALLLQIKSHASASRGSSHGAGRTHGRRDLHAYRRAWDPISALDGGAATTSAPTWNPHSYTGYSRTSSVQPITGQSDRRSNVFVM